MLFDRAQQLGAGPLDPVGFRYAAFHIEPRGPEGADNSLAFMADVEDMPGFQRPHLAEDRARRQRVAEAEEIVDAVLVEVEGVFGKLAQRGDFRREGEAT